jgi:type II secretory pathway pseudopilin PulG
VELLVATICLSITAFGILTAIAFADNQNTLSRQRMLALSIASSEMETYRSKAYGNSIVAGVFTTNLASSNLPKPAQKVVTVSATSDPVVFYVSVQVSWTVTTSGGPTTRAIHLDSALRNNDVP